MASIIRHAPVSGSLIPDGATIAGHTVCLQVVLALDCHAVVTRQMIDVSTALVASRTHPHVDVVETGMRAANILLETLSGKVRPVTACHKIPLLLPPPDDGTKFGAMSAWCLPNGKSWGPNRQCFAKWASNRSRLR